jgi:hypothetical protein
MANRSCTTRRRSSAGKKRSSRHSRNRVGTFGHASSGHGCCIGVVTEGTAGVHVSRILAKLGVAGRVEAAAIAHRPPEGHTPRHATLAGVKRPTFDMERGS